MSACKILRALRKERRSIQKQAACVLHIRRQVCVCYEQGTRELPARHLKTLCRFYIHHS